eukprot:PITA_32895
MEWHIYQMDVKTMFLNEVIEEEVYIEQPERFEIFNSESHVCRLKRACNELKQAPRAWYTRIDNYFIGLGFSKSELDPTLYQIVVEGKLLVIVLYVDDLILMGDELLILLCKEDLAREFEMKDLGLLHYFLGLEIWQRSDGLFVSQGKYAWGIVEKFNMHGCKLVDTPLLGDWAGSPTDKKSTSGGIFSIGLTTVSWYSRKKRSMALSSAEAEYMAASLATCEVIWMRKTLVGLFGSHLEPTVIYCDNQSCIKLSANLVFHDRSKHIDIMYHHIRDCVQRRIMLLSYIPMEDQDVDILTKVLTRRKFKYHRGRIGVANNPYIFEREC